MSTALVLIDIQNDYFPEGNLPLSGSVEASMQAKKILEFFRQKGEPIIHIQHVNIRPGVPIFNSGSPGVEIHENVKPLSNEIVFQKHYPNSFRETPLLDHLKAHEITSLVICGNMTHMCVDATTRAAFDYGFECTVIGDACATMDLTYKNVQVSAEKVHASFLAALGWTYATIVDTADYIANRP